MASNFYQMIRWMRPANTPALDMFCEIYLEPVFGKPDVHNNYIKIINNPDGSAPNLCFTAHSDTVHQDGGIQDIVSEGNLLYSVGDDCLGADCTTGIWLILEMIREKVPGVYVIHDSEEVGCKGSRALVRDFPEWLEGIDAVISFDRKGKESIVTHQIGTRTASDAFAKSLALALDMPELKPDSGGVYTDSNEYIDVVKECTNISVGYFAQHTKNECQDVEFMVHLRNKLVKADCDAGCVPWTSFYKDGCLYLNGCVPPIADCYLHDTISQCFQVVNDLYTHGFEDEKLGDLSADNPFKSLEDEHFSYIFQNIAVSSQTIETAATRLAAYRKDCVEAIKSVGHCRDAMDKWAQWVDELRARLSADQLISIAAAMWKLECKRKCGGFFVFRFFQQELIHQLATYQGSEFRLWKNSDKSPAYFDEYEGDIMSAYVGENHLGQPYLYSINGEGKTLVLDLS